MKRYGNLMPCIADMENLRLAYWKARRGKEGKREVQDFAADLEQNLAGLRQQLLSKDVKIGQYHYFKIYDPKERLICAASFPERIVHHAIMNVCHPIFDRQLIHHSYATRIGKGTYKALDAAVMNAKRYQWCAKLDVRKYFDSISHDILKQLLMKIFKDKDLMQVFFAIIDSYSVNEGYGIPIGNLTSQYFANYYLSSADHYAQERLSVKAYIRYMDDILCFDHDKFALKEKVSGYVAMVRTELGLQFKPVAFMTTKTGVPFLGYKVYPCGLRLTSRSKRRFVKKMRNNEQLLASVKQTQYEFARHIIPLIAFVGHVVGMKPTATAISHRVREVSSENICWI